MIMTQADTRRYINGLTSNNHSGDSVPVNKNNTEQVNKNKTTIYFQMQVDRKSVV